MTPFKIKEVKPRVFLFEFKNNYDMCMYFLRYQEYYESPSSKFRGKSFEIFDFMKWYSEKYGGDAFTYPRDWDGFNIPGNIIMDVWMKHISDKNIYDYEMYNAWKECNYKSGGNPFYIIGAVKGKKNALKHEIAHAFFTLYPEYKSGMTQLVKELDPSIRQKLNGGLKKLGYTPKVYIDEIQAYLSTGISPSFGVGKLSNECKPFQKFFKDFSRKVK